MIRILCAGLTAWLVFVTGVVAAPGGDQGGRQAASLDTMIGQMLMVGFQGTDPNDASVQRIVAQVSAGRIGGVILMDRNIRSPKQVRILTAALRARAPLPFLISTDQEGGYVQRLGPRKGFRGFPSARKVALTMRPADASSLYRQMAVELAGVGINVNFGPTIDIHRAVNPIIGRLGRGYDADPQKIADYAGAFIAAHRGAGVLTAAKHFPGHGSSLTDSHKGFVDLSRTWSRAELEPYRMLLRRQPPNMIMVGHLYHPDFSPKDRLPASLSQTAINGVLRQQLGYSGVVISDDMNMGAIRQCCGVKAAVVLAVSAGADILLAADDPPGGPSFAVQATAALRDALVSGRISKGRIQESYDRIMKMKGRLAADLPDETASNPPGPRARRADPTEETLRGR